ncbi:MAG: phosphatidate cytidylyltransferase [candidate division WOR-3 bacterium]
MNRLAKRTIVGSILGIITAIVLYVHPMAVLIISLIWIMLATNEFLRIFRLKEIYLNRLLMIMLSLLFPLFFYLKIDFIYYLIIPSVLFVYTLIRREKYYLIVPVGFFTLFYLGFLPSHLLYLKVWVYTQQQLNNLSKIAGFFTVFFPLGFTWVNDTAAYLIGSIMGRHKLAEKLSPHKTIEGFVGSVIVSVGFSYLYFKLLFPQMLPLFSIIIGLVLSIAAQIGDLVESGFKRDANLKDSSRALGEHGGFLDRIDSLLFTIPMYYYILLYLFNRIR